MTKQKTYRTQTTEVSEHGNYCSISIGSDKFDELTKKFRTFRYIKTYDFEPNWKYAEDTITVALTVSAEKRRQKYFYFAHWRQPGWGKNKDGISIKGILRKTWIGEKPTIEKLNEVCDKFYNRFCEDNRIDQ